MQVRSPRRAEHFARLLCFGEPLIDRAVAPHFTGGEVAQPDAQPHRCVLRDAAAHPDLEIVGMRAEYEKVDWIHSEVIVGD